MVMNFLEFFVRFCIVLLVFCLVFLREIYVEDCINYFYFGIVSFIEYVWYFYGLFFWILDLNYWFGILYVIVDNCMVMCRSKILVR